MPSVEESGLTFSIGGACRETGLKPEVIRAWERRHRAVEPRRTASGHRRYSEDDVRRLKLLARACEAGHSISTIARLSDERLSRLGSTGSAPEAASPADGSRADGEGRLERAEALIRSFDQEALAHFLARELADLGRERLVTELIRPLLERLGRGWAKGGYEVAHEHLATAAIRTFLGGLLLGSPSRDSPRIVITTPPGERHELGALLVAVTVGLEGWSGLYLGPDTPIDGILDAISGARARAVALSATAPFAGSLTETCASLVEEIPASRIFAGGEGASVARSALEGLGVSLPTTLRQFREGLRSAADGRGARAL